MALLQSEVERIKSELGYSVHTSGAIPYRTVWNTFDLVIKNFVQAGAITTSTTAVVATGAVQQVAVVLADATGFSQFDIVVVDVDSRQERATVQSIAGSTITVLLALTHGGTYPVTVEGGESIVRDYLRQLKDIAGLLTTNAGTANLKAVDEVHFHSAASGSGMDLSTLAQLRKEQRRLRDELARALNVENRQRMSASRSHLIALC